MPLFLLEPMYIVEEAARRLLKDMNSSLSSRRGSLLRVGLSLLLLGVCFALVSKQFRFRKGIGNIVTVSIGIGYHFCFRLDWWLDNIAMSGSGEA